MEKECASVVSKDVINVCKAVSPDTVKARLRTLCSTRNLYIKDLPNIEKSLYRKVHRYVSSIEHYSAIKYRNHKEIISDQNRLLTDLYDRLASLVSQVEYYRYPGYV